MDMSLLYSPGLMLVASAIAAAALQSAASGWAMAVLRRALRPRAFAVLVGGPGIVLHEMCHLLVSMLSGHYIERLALNRVFAPYGAQGAVVVRYDPRSLRHRFGLSLSALAPSLLPLALLAGALHAFDLVPRRLDPLAAAQLLRPLLQPAAAVIAAPALILIVAMMRLSRQDWWTALGALLALATVAVGVELFFPHAGSPLTWPPVLALQSAAVLTLLASGAVLVAAAPFAALQLLLGPAPAAPAPLHDGRPGRH